MQAKRQKTCNMKIFILDLCLVFLLVFFTHHVVNEVNGPVERFTDPGDVLQSL